MLDILKMGYVYNILIFYFREDYFYLLVVKYFFLSIFELGIIWSLLVENIEFEVIELL